MDLEEKHLIEIDLPEWIEVNGQLFDRITDLYPS